MTGMRRMESEGRLSSQRACTQGKRMTRPKTTRTRRRRPAPAQGESRLGDPRQGRRNRPAARGAARRWPRARRGRARHRQDDSRQGAGALAGGQVLPHPVHARPAAHGHRRRHDLFRRERRLHLSPRSRLRQHRAGRRDQPRLAAHAVRAARGDGRRQVTRWRFATLPKPFLVSPANPVEHKVRIRCPRAALRFCMASPRLSPRRTSSDARDQDRRTPSPRSRPHVGGTFTRLQSRCARWTSRPVLAISASSPAAGRRAAAAGVSRAGAGPAPLRPGEAVSMAARASAATCRAWRASSGARSSSRSKRAWRLEGVRCPEICGPNRPDERRIHAGLRRRRSAGRRSLSAGTAGTLRCSSCSFAWSTFLASHITVAC